MDRIPPVSAPGQVAAGFRPPNEVRRQAAPALHAAPQTVKPATGQHDHAGNAGGDSMGTHDHPDILRAVQQHDGTIDRHGDRLADLERKVAILLHPKRRPR